MHDNNKRLAVMTGGEKRWKIKQDKDHAFILTLVFSPHILNSALKYPGSSKKKKKEHKIKYTTKLLFFN